MKKSEHVCRLLCCDANDFMRTGHCEDCDFIDGCQRWQEFSGTLGSVLFGIREPSEAQIEAARRQIVNVSWSWTRGKPKSRDPHTLAVTVWQSMIDPLIEENENGKALQRRDAEALFASASD